MAISKYSAQLNILDFSKFEAEILEYQERLRVLNSSGQKGQIYLINAYKRCLHIREQLLKDAQCGSKG